MAFFRIFYHIKYVEGIPQQFHSELGALGTMLALGFPAGRQLWSECLCPSEILVLKSSSPSDGIWRLGLWEVMRT